MRHVLALLLSLVAVLTPGPALAAGDVVLKPVEDAGYGIRSVVPDGWVRVNLGLYARQSTTADPTLLALQSAPATPAQIWPTLLAQFGLQAIPEPSGSRTTEAFDWSLYQLVVDAPGGSQSLDLAMAEDAGTTFLVLLVATPGEADALRAAVFLPAVDQYQRLDAAATVDPATLPYASRQVSFPGGSPDVVLAGTLTLPEGVGPFAVVVLMSGSGPQDRDESLAPVARIKPFALIADALTRAGIAVLRYDDRGVGASTGDYSTAVIADLTADGQAAVDFAASQPQVDPDRIGILGHSEGGIYIATIAAHDPRVAFAISMAGPASPGSILMTAQYVALARVGGASDTELAFTRQFATDVFAAILEGDTAKVEQVIRDAYGALWDRQTPAVRATLGTRDAYAEGQVTAQLPTLTSPWFHSLIASDPGADWATVTAPVLALYGGKDVQVVVAQEAPAMTAALEATGTSDRQVITLPNANHLFQEAVTGAVAEYATLDQTLTPAFLPTLVAWVTQYTQPTGP